ncbi:MAG: hypothetical protein AAB596_01445 [Patescibacteria group bacterium]
MKFQYHKFKIDVINLRKNGKTYSEINRIIGKTIPKSTLSNWCRSIKLSKKQQQKIKKLMENNINKGREIALAVNKEKRRAYLESVKNRIEHLQNIAENKDVAKIMIAMLYLGEGSKTRRGSIMIGNSDPKIINLFLRLLRYCYYIDEKKFRCTVQCRADQNIKKLEKFWAKITGIPLNQFYNARVDSRTIGQKSRNLDYKGVCRIDYFSADIFNEIMKIIEITI